MSFIEQTLSRGEEIQEIFEQHWIYKYAVTMHFFIAVLTIGLWLPFAIWFWLEYRNLEQGLTNKRVIFKHGIISRKTNEMRLNAIESIVINQGIFDRMLNYGNIVISGRGSGNITLKYVPDPMTVKRKIEDLEHAVS